MNFTFFTICVCFFHTTLIFASGTVLIVVFAWPWSWPWSRSCSTVSRHTAVGGLTSHLRLIHGCSALNDASDGLSRERGSVFSSDNRHLTISSRKLHKSSCLIVGT
jgi:hypothetical protein